MVRSKSGEKTTWDVQNLVNNGINYQPDSTVEFAGFFTSTAISFFLGVHRLRSNMFGTRWFFEDEVSIEEIRESWEDFAEVGARLGGGEKTHAIIMGI